MAELDAELNMEEKNTKVQSEEISVSEPKYSSSSLRQKLTYAKQQSAKQQNSNLLKPSSLSFTER